MALKENQVVTGEIRLSYANVFEAKAMNEGETPKYGTMVLVPKKDKATVNLLTELQDKVINSATAKSKYGGKVPAKTLLKLPLRDGDEEYPDNPDFKGMLFFNASNSRRPRVIDVDKNDILDKDEVYSGCYGRVIVTFYPFAGKAKGVAASLDAFMKTKDGENLGGGGADLDVFDEELF
jgi:hypothetical protein